ncbi:MULTISPECIES: MFS transporter [Achromobacter]|uniref:MFS transporter n=1 Tax=Alcaligenes xylosoxydans xylosoxydans TaxID=85698 RepID=A0A424WDH8_ALCXX|nr:MULTISPECIES: MFS transporter [Achromobacter]MBC9906045.1 MFS transporter [Achromobacter xylosoxidans]MBD0869771.1 MFS transporter [Achromobacter xylosoxidans]QNP85952.1 MFS transporter [Achromobacter xylosoxidans]RPJ91297.1 MFS transporter [Achromobacter xylosoxidans]
MPDQKNPAARGTFAPLRQSVFAVLWAATVLGNVGSFMRDVASSWLVTDLSASPAAVALIQTAATLPIFLLAIPAGVLSDILDRRRFLIFVQLLLASVSGTLLLLSHFGALTVDYLIALTFVGGIGAALMGPTWQSIVPELVPREELKGAVALNSLGINIARAIGPAAGGLILASFGAAVTYGLDVLSYVFVIAALLWWKRPAAVDSALSENFFGAFRAGLRYTRASKELHRVLLRAAVFFLFASAVWALLPLVARQMLGGSSGFYGVLLGAVGAGAIIGALLLPRLGARLNADGLVLLASVASAAVMAVLVFAPPQWLAVLMLVVLGMGWITALTTFNGVAQAVLPNWVRGRGLAVYLMVFNGAMAAGSLGWGLVAREIGVPYALAVSAAGLVAVALLFHRASLPVGEADLQASNHWPEPLVAEPVAHDRGPVLVQVEYRIRQEDRPAFLDAMQRLSQERLRDGAYAWGVVEHTSDPQRVVEWFFVESWAEHLRQHHRVSHADADLQAEALRFHMGPDKPEVHHFLALKR